MKRIPKKLLPFLLFLYFFLSIPTIVLAQARDPRDECGGPDSGQIDTAIGCIPVENTTQFTGFILRWGIGIGGGVALVLIAYSGIQMATAAGNPQKVEGAKSLFNAALTGLLFMIFSTVALRFVGIDILGITGLGS